jgi:chemotaxis signal transduction protein
VSGGDAVARARELAEVFDRSFSLPEQLAEGRGKPALAIRTGTDAYLLPLDGLSAVARRAKIVPLPGAPPAQIGLAGIRGGLVSVFSLPALLGYDVAHAEIGWVAVSAGTRPLALGFEVLHGQVAVPPGAIVAAPAGSRRHVSGLVRLAGDTNARGLLDLASIVSRISATPTGGR